MVGNAQGRGINLPKPGDVEHWTIKSGGGWGHPLHLHFEEGKTLRRDSKGNGIRGISEMERNKRKDVWTVGKLRGNVMFQVTFGEFGGAYVNHCHNTVHEDNAMLLRYDLIKGSCGCRRARCRGTPLPAPARG